MVLRAESFDQVEKEVYSSVEPFGNRSKKSNSLECMFMALPRPVAVAAIAADQELDR
jgi:hypothetical protein